LLEDLVEEEIPGLTDVLENAQEMIVASQNSGESLKLNSVKNGCVFIIKKPKEKAEKGCCRIF